MVLKSVGRKADNLHTAIFTELLKNTEPPVLLPWWIPLRSTNAQVMPIGIADRENPKPTLVQPLTVRCKIHWAAA